jgi:hypothetical protein
MTREERMLALMADTDKHFAAYYDVIPNLIRKRGYKIGIEIGVFAGGHARRILGTTELHSLIGIDPYMIYKHGGMPSGIESQEDFDCLCDLVAKRLSPTRYQLLKMTSDTAFQLLDSELRYDFVFIDGFHSYDQVKKDLINYSQLIRKGGVISCHDYHHPSYPNLTKAIDEFAKQHHTKVVCGPLHLIYMEW